MKRSFILILFLKFICSNLYSQDSSKDNHKYYFELSSGYGYMNADGVDAKGPAGSSSRFNPTSADGGASSFSAFLGIQMKSFYYIGFRITCTDFKSSNTIASETSKYTIDYAYKLYSFDFALINFNFDSGIYLKSGLGATRAIDTEAYDENSGMMSSVFFEAGYKYFITDNIAIGVAYCFDYKYGGYDGSCDCYECSPFIDDATINSLKLNITYSF